ncbi:AAA family ATPase [Paracoccus yeei]|uniref:AAA family ATPase n=2 Tax=Paracoccus TaxID=265 RepID=A0A1V0GSE7_9RHOB|nr:MULTISPECIES: AAA family ATPase [Paracoccus]ARC36761.1 AAA family ATPase [Paracoccus yeei]ARC37305.1 AAA family ATPase [Paracoccus yeei]AWX93201.1 AAA family ATPase [Paracoccus mutanolyticus]AWX93604.1 AAA family ATPase [Paracoccus mutanolyticus]
MTTPNRPSPAPAWLPFARKLLHRLREPTGEALPDPELAAELGLASAPAALTPRTLLTALRLAASLGGQAAVTAALRPGALTLLRGIPAEDIPLLRHVLPALLPGAWRIRELKPDDGAPREHPGATTLHLITAPAPGRGDALHQPLIAGLDSAAPLLILLAEGAALPDARPGRHAVIHEFAPIGAEIVWALLEALQRLPRQGAAADRALLRQAFDSGLHLDSTDVLLALRAPTLAELAERLATTHSPAPGDAAAPPTLDSLTGDGPALQAARHLVEDLRLWRAGRLDWSEITRSALFYGPPGTGKSWLAQAMAASAGVSAITGSFGEWQAAGHLGEMLKAMRRTFAEARARAPAVLILDELDAVGNRGDNAGSNQNYRVQVINAFLALMDEIARAPGVLVVATCNHIDLIDPAVLRPGRFDLRIEVPLPDAATLAGVLRRHLALPEADLAVLARHCVGLSLAECDAELRAARGAARRAGVALDAAGLMARLGAGRDPAIDRRVALHECGHALVTTALGRGTVQRLALAGSGGTTRIARRPQAGLIADHTDLLAELMAGRAAERLVLGAVSAGAGGPPDSDLALATRVALDLETRYGLGAEGPLWLGTDSAAPMRDPALRARCRRHLETAEARAAALLAPHRALLEDMAAALVARRELSDDDLTPWLQRLDLEVAAQVMLDIEQPTPPPD